MTTSPKTASQIWEEAVAAAAASLMGAKEAGGPYGSRDRRPSNFGRASVHVAHTVHNPYRENDIEVRTSAEWAELVGAAAELGAALARFQNARDAYVDTNPYGKK